MRIINEVCQNPEYNFALLLAMKNFNNKFDKGGNRYIDHLIRVKNKVMECGTVAVVSAILHDILEDTILTKEDLLEMGINEESVGIIDLLTRKNGEMYSEYISKILDSNNLIALKIKKADIEDNMNLSRIPCFGEKDVKLLEKRYIPNWYKINNKINGLKEDL